ncbi:MAG: gluconokinase [Chloroflexota bacterium]|nr:gluconokinase [Chloroflexota bacterium]
MQDTGPALVLTIDIGSSSLRTNLYTVRARQLVHLEAQLPYEVHTTPDGGVEIDPGALLDCLYSAIDRTVELAGERASNIRGVGMCSLVSNVLGVDERGEPTTPIYTWADTRCAREAEELRAALNQEDVYEQTGCPIHTSYLPSRLLWLQRDRPDVYGRTVRWISLGDLVHLKLFGRAWQSLSVASWSGLLNRHSLTWDRTLLSHLGVGEDYLPELVDVDDCLSGLQGDYAKRWPPLRDVPWYPCVGDGATGNLGSGCCTPRDLAIQVGTSGAARVLIPGTAGKIPHGLWCYRLDRHTSLLGGALSEGGNLLDWLSRTLHVGNLDQVEREAAALPPDSHGLTLLPFLAGERSPGWHGSARAAISGLSLDTRPAHIMRAAQEAIAYRFAALYELLCDVLPAPERIIASGGALLNVPGWIRMLADVLGRPVTASGEDEASSRGAALLALRSLGIISDFDAVPAALGESYQPDMERHAIYLRGRERQRELYDKLISS